MWKQHSVCKLLGFIIFTVLQDSDQGSDADKEEEEEEQQQERKPTQQYSIAAQNITNTNVTNPQQQQQGQQNINTITMGSNNKIRIKQMKLAVTSFMLSFHDANYWWCIKSKHYTNMGMISCVEISFQGLLPSKSSRQFEY